MIRDIQSGAGGLSEWTLVFRGGWLERIQGH